MEKNFLDRVLNKVNSSITNSDNNNKIINITNELILFLNMNFNEIKELIRNFSKATNNKKVIVSPNIDFDIFNSKEYIELIKRSQSLGIFIIYPDIKDLKNMRMYPSTSKILDTIHCNIFRPKFNYVKISSSKCYPLLRILIDKYYQNIYDIGKQIIRNQLYTDLHDGTISIKTEYGLLTLGTKTNKGDIKANDLVLVRYYDPITNTVYYCGDKIPSSDSPVDYVFFRNNKKYNVLIHTHYKKITYNEDLQDYRISNYYIPYGTLKLAKQILEYTKKDNHKKFFIMYGHGETVYDTTFDSAITRLLNIKDNID
ncbi:MAG: class II aldolase/adducin family protein [Sulfolobus sp.]